MEAQLIIGAPVESEGVFRPNRWKNGGISSMIKTIFETYTSSCGKFPISDSGRSLYPEGTMDDSVCSR
jgi:hypothetical protein